MKSATLGYESAMKGRIYTQAIQEEDGGPPKTSGRFYP
jgi:hypothetical protein